MRSTATILIWLFIISSLIVAVICAIKAINRCRIKDYLAGLGLLLLSLILGSLLLFCLAPAYSTTPEHPRRSRCINNLRQVNLFLKMYAGAHKEIYPASFSELAGTNYVKSPNQAQVFICPSTRNRAGNLNNIQDWTDYAYVAGLSEADHAACVMAFCPPENHKEEGAIVMFLGGQVQWFPCKPLPKSPSGQYQPTFQELTSNPALFYGTSDEAELADPQKRTRVIYPHKAK